MLAYPMDYWRYTNKRLLNNPDGGCKPVSGYDEYKFNF